MTTPTDREVAEVAGRLTTRQQDIILAAIPADSFEHWLLEDVNDPRIASSDWVLTPFGEAVRAHLQKEQADG